MVVTIFVSVLGVAEYLLYEPEELQESRTFSKLYLLGMLLVGMFGLIGILLIVVFNMSLSATWSGFTILLGMVLGLALIQYKMHQNMGLEKSPIRRKLSRSNDEKQSEEVEGSVYENNDEEKERTPEDQDDEEDSSEKFIDDSDRDVLGYEK